MWIAVTVFGVFVMKNQSAAKTGPPIQFSYIPARPGMIDHEDIIPLWFIAMHLASVSRILVLVLWLKVWFLHWLLY